MVSKALLADVFPELGFTFTVIALLADILNVPSSSAKACMKVRERQIQTKTSLGFKKMQFEKTQSLACGRFLSGLAQFLVYKPVGFFSTHVCMN